MTVIINKFEFNKETGMQFKKVCIKKGSVKPTPPYRTLRFPIVGRIIFNIRNFTNKKRENLTGISSPQTGVKKMISP